MKDYKGLEEDSIRGGGDWVTEHGYGNEMLNFLPINEKVCGFVRPPAIVSDAKINLDRIANLNVGDKLTGVTVVWFSYRPRISQVIVGWYRNANAYRNWQSYSDDRNVVIDKMFGTRIVTSYFFMTKEENAILLPIEDRRFRIPREKYFTGQSNTWYADADYSTVRKYVGEVLEYIENYTPGYRTKSKYFIKEPLPIPTAKSDLEEEDNIRIQELVDRIERKPDNLDAIKEIAEIFIEYELFIKAIKYIDRALGLKEDDWELYYWKALCLEDFYDFEEAMNSYEKALRCEMPPKDRAEIFSYIGNLYCDQLEEYEKAIIFHDKAIEVDDSVDVYHYNKSLSLYELGRNEEALECLFKANELQSDDVDTLNQIGVVYEELNKYKDAILYYQKAISCDPEDEDAIGNLAALFEKVGIYSRAIETWQLIQRRGKLPGFARRAINRLSGKRDKPIIAIAPIESVIKKNDQLRIEEQPISKIPDEPKTDSEKIKIEQNDTEQIPLYEEFENREISYNISKEKYLEEEICRLINAGLIFDGELEILNERNLHYGQQFPTEVGRIDILCKNKKTDSLVVFEIKKDKSADIVIGQISRYMGFVKKKIAKPDQSVEGIIITYEKDRKLEYAVSIHDNIRVFTYAVNISEWQDEE
jgi:tetratricopeptide (TPR) repeat protein